MNVLVTGGAGYIGSHTVVELLRHGHCVAVVDNLSNGNIKAIRRVEEITGQRVPFYLVDIRNQEALRQVMAGRTFDCCIHFAGLKVVGESVQKPLEYYSNNVAGTLTLLEMLKKNGCKNIIFSSTAAVYGDATQIPVSECYKKGCCKTPYSQTKHMVEEILMDLCRSDPSWNAVILRYFNPVGAHPSGRIGEAHNGVPSNLMPYITQVAAGKYPHLNIFGNDYDTPDGTGIRDFIHVMDLAAGHVSALKAIERNCGMEIYNLGTGKGCSVLEIVQAFQRATGIGIPYEIKPRRPGDIAVSYADVSKAWEELSWKAERSLEDMCRDAWNWQKNNINGFK